MGMNPRALLTAGVGKVTRPPTVNHRQLLLPRRSLNLNISNTDAGYSKLLKNYKKKKEKNMEINIIHTRHNSPERGGAPGKSDDV